MVHIPDDPLYLYEFLDAYEYFGKWVAWERDEAHNGKLAAATWRRAIEKTRETLLAGCGNTIGDDEMSDILEKLDEISERLKELEDMDVIVNQTVNTGCGCSGDGSTTPTTNTVEFPSIDPDDTGVEPAYDDTVYAVVDAVKCRVANWLADKTIEVLRGMANISAGGVAFVVVVSALIGVFTAFNGAPLDGILWGSLVFGIGRALIDLSQLDDFTADDLDVLANEIASMKQDFVCALYGWATAGELSSALLDFLYARIDEISIPVGWSPETVTEIKGMFAKIFGSKFSNYIVQNVSVIVPADFVATHDCTCGATGDACPTQNVVLAGVGTFPAVLDGIEYWVSEFNGQTGYHEVILELADNWCVDIAYRDAGNALDITPEVIAHEKCSSGVMVASDGSCLRRFVARSLAPFVAAVDFLEVTADCNCLPSGAIALDLTYTFDPDAELWQMISRSAWTPDYGTGLRQYPRVSKGDAVAIQDAKDLSQRLGGALGVAEIYIERIEVDCLFDSTYGNSGAMTSELDVYGVGFVDVVNTAIPIPYGSPFVWEKSIVPVNMLISAAISNTAVLKMTTFHNGSDAQDGILFDNIRLVGWYKNHPE